MIYRRGKNGIYSYRFRFAGRIIHESAHTQSKTLAREAERNRRRELEERINGIRKRGLPPTFEHAAQEWMKSREHLVRPGTDRMARVALHRVLPVFGPNLLCDIDVRSIQEYQQRRLSQGAQGRTINIETGVLRQILKAYEYWRPIEGRMRTLRERKDIGRALLPDEERRLLEAAQSLDSACYTAVMVALNTAMRHSEILGLRWRQIDLAQRALTVGQSKTTAGTGRLIPLNTAAFNALVKWAKRVPDAIPDHYVFPWCGNRQVDPTRPAKGWRTAWRHTLKLSGVKCRFHDLRVTCITKMAESQTPDLVIMSVAGHVSRAMLEHYSRIRTEAKREALERLVQPNSEGAVNQNVHQLLPKTPEPSRNLLN
jgi:integrase